MPAAKKVKTFGAVAPHTVPVLHAADLTLYILRNVVKLPSLEALMDNLDNEDVKAKLEPFILTEEQIALIDEHWTDILMVRATTPAVNITWCPECERVAAVSGTAPTKCQLTTRCTGKPVKSGVAKKLEHA